MYIAARGRDRGPNEFQRHLMYMLGLLEGNSNRTFIEKFFIAKRTFFFGISDMPPIVFFEKILRGKYFSADIARDMVRFIMNSSKLFMFIIAGFGARVHIRSSYLCCVS